MRTAGRRARGRAREEPSQRRDALVDAIGWNVGEAEPEAALARFGIDGEGAAGHERDVLLGDGAVQQRHRVRALRELDPGEEATARVRPPRALRQLPPERGVHALAALAVLALEQLEVPREMARLQVRGDRARDER